MGTHGGPDTVTDGLVLCVDAANKKSYAGHGTNLNSTIGDEVGVLTNNPSFNTTEARGTITLDGSNDFVTFGNASVANFDHDDSFTYEIWVRSTANASKYIMGKNESSGNYRGVEITYRGNANVGKIGYFIRNTNSSSNRIVVSTENATYRGNNWHHIVCTYNGSGEATGMNIIIDTVNDTTTTSTGNISGGITSTSNLCIGSRNGAATYIPGTFGAFKIYNKVLTSAEILQNYNALKNRFGL
jgi:hypothetical protein